MNNLQGVKENLKNSLDKMPLKSNLAAFYKACTVTEDFSQKFIIPQLEGILKQSGKEKILIDIYRSIHCWVKTVACLNHPVHFQAMASATRSIFELLVDMKLIADDNIENGIEKFDAFRTIEKFRVAKRFADFKSKHPNAKTMAGQKKIEVASNREAEEKANKLKILWGNKKEIRHWSGLGMEDRARKAGLDYEAFYNESFSLLSWYIHSGLVGMRDMSETGLIAVYGNSTRIIYEMFLDAILLISKELRLDIAIPSFKELIKELKMVPGFVILEEHKKYLEELNKNKGNTDASLDDKP